MSKQVLTFSRDHGYGGNRVSIPCPPWGSIDVDEREHTRPDARITLLRKLSDKEACSLYRREIRKHLINGM